MSAVVARPISRPATASPTRVCRAWESATSASLRPRPSWRPDVRSSDRARVASLERRTLRAPEPRQHVAGHSERKFMLAHEHLADLLLFEQLGLLLAVG